LFDLGEILVVEDAFYAKPNVKLFGIFSLILFIGGVILAFFIGRELARLGVYTALAGAVLLSVYRI